MHTYTHSASAAQQTGKGTFRTAGGALILWKRERGEVLVSSIPDRTTTQEEGEEELALGGGRSLARSLLRARRDDHGDPTRL